YIESYLYEHGKADFKALLEKGNSRMEVIVTFLVILELMKLGKISVAQEDTFDVIRIIWQPDAEVSAVPMQMTALD
ncbi:MAG: segregation/condensation protein A, partial [Lachnospiraceae bacterium]|nr:segregation/condensation protein A [Lachnospiraceae bacterium]